MKRSRNLLVCGKENKTKPQHWKHWKPCCWYFDAAADNVSGQTVALDGAPAGDGRAVSSRNSRSRETD